MRGVHDWIDVHLEELLKGDLVRSITFECNAVLVVGFQHHNDRALQIVLIIMIEMGDVPSSCNQHGHSRTAL